MGWQCMCIIDAWNSAWYFFSAGQILQEQSVSTCNFPKATTAAGVVAECEDPIYPCSIVHVCISKQCLLFVFKRERPRQRPGNWQLHPLWLWFCFPTTSCQHRTTTVFNFSWCCIHVPGQCWWFPSIIVMEPASCFPASMEITHHYQPWLTLILVVDEVFRSSSRMNDRCPSHRLKHDKPNAGNCHQHFFCHWPSLLSWSKSTQNWELPYFCCYWPSLSIKNQRLSLAPIVSITAETGLWGRQWLPHNSDVRGTGNRGPMIHHRWRLTMDIPGPSWEPEKGGLKGWIVDGLWLW